MYLEYFNNSDYNKGGYYTNIIFILILFIKCGENGLKSIVCGAFGSVASVITYFVGGWDYAVVTLLIFMLVDYITGVIVAGVFHKSTKTGSGSLKSTAGFKGLCKKFVTFLFVCLGARLDMLLGINYIREGICFAFILNEFISIVENAGLMGIPMPKIVTNAIDVLQKKVEEA